ncbi:MAG: DUF1428 domain-containing protein [Gammaproteobacteria bacterium]|nr:DUF1428 domain-containing protein [Gammaproteobacteria bacterium]
MTYRLGFLIPVLPEKKSAYRELAVATAPFFMEYGAQRIVECWGENVPRGELTDMFRGVNAEGEENVVFAWIDWASEAACNQAHDAMSRDERMQVPTEMPFDGRRMVFAGFETLGESGPGGRSGYVQGYVAPVPKDNREAFAGMCATMREVAIDCGALRAADCWGETIADGKVTDFKRAVKALAGEAVAFGFVEWSSKAAFEQGSQKMRDHSRMPALGASMPLDGKRLIHGGFEILMDTNQEARR